MKLISLLISISIILSIFSRLKRKKRNKNVCKIKDLYLNNVLEPKNDNDKLGLRVIPENCSQQFLSNLIQTDKGEMYIPFRLFIENFRSTVSEQDVSIASSLNYEGNLSVIKTIPLSSKTYNDYQELSKIISSLNTKIDQARNEIIEQKKNTISSLIEYVLIKEAANKFVKSQKDQIQKEYQNKINKYREDVNNLENNKKTLDDEKLKLIEKITGSSTLIDDKIGLIANKKREVENLNNLLDKVKNNQEDKLSEEEYQKSIKDIKTNVENYLTEILYTASPTEKKIVEDIREYFNKSTPSEEDKDNLISQIEKIRS